MASTGLHRFSTFILTSIAAGLAAALAILLIRPDLLQQDNTADATFIQAPATDLSRESGPVSYSDAVQSAAPSVVNIYAAKISTEKQTLIFRDPVLQYLFGNLLPEKSRERMETSLGSGVIVSANGYVLTNYHVVEGADQIRVVLSAGQEHAVTLIGADPDTDLAVLKIEADDNLPAVTMGGSTQLRVGDVVLAIGNPFGVGQTVTMGIISATGRSDLGINTYENFIQTDAAINPGNSGGALINAHGELIGINTAIFSKTGGSQGIGFAIPVNLATGVMKQLIERGRVVRGWLGISGQNVTKDLADSFGLHETDGVLVSGTQEGGPADLAGIRPGDVIVSIDGKAVKNMNEVLDIVSSAGPKARLEIEIWRGNELSKQVTVTGERPAASRTR